MPELTYCGSEQKYEDCLEDGNREKLKRGNNAMSNFLTNFLSALGSIRISSSSSECSFEAISRLSDLTRSLPGATVSMGLFSRSVIKAHPTSGARNNMGIRMLLCYLRCERVLEVMSGGEGLSDTCWKDRRKRSKEVSSRVPPFGPLDFESLSNIIFYVRT
ncbi:hypothetical protein GALMADRAFT_222382 [Galerina marginata CBS 339.88]|uniref:Uncharacterized protein n=1 Tax=Galerina marginata (strain CBS 339.88) TaxID=685588 RepID=A0A067TP79_GALM3|nr:hypothetical protein GALMADRAFT_222382 [Galerina marginata CBS 339.88]